MWETTLQFLPQMVPAGYTSKMTSKDIYPDKGKFCLPAGMTSKTPFTPSYPELSRAIPSYPELSRAIPQEKFNSYPAYPALVLC